MPLAPPVPIVHQISYSNWVKQEQACTFLRHAGKLNFRTLKPRPAACVLARQSPISGHQKSQKIFVEIGPPRVLTYTPEMSARCVCCGRRPAAAAYESGSRASIRLAPSLMESWTPRRGHGLFDTAGPIGRMSHGLCVGVTAPEATERRREVVNSVRASFLFYS